MYICWGDHMINLDMNTTEVAQKLMITTKG